MDALFFRPLLKRLVWGGRQLGELLGKPIGEGSDYAESWEVVDHGADQSVVSGGPEAGRTLRELVRDRPGDLFGEGIRHDHFPLLLKFLDCNRVLSVQVHPDDAYASRMTPPDLGKTEAWYVVAAKPDAVIYAGLRPGVDPQQLRAACGDGSVGGLLHEVRPRVGDCFFIPAGTVHALGGGLVVAEIQQSSDTTFRLFDWNRVDAAGRGRELHVDQAIAVTDFSRGPVDPQHPHPDADGLETLVRCDKFILRRAILQATLPSPSIGATHEPHGSLGATHLSEPDHSLPSTRGSQPIGATHEPGFGGAGANGRKRFSDRVSLGGDGKMRIVAVAAGAAQLIAADGSVSALPLGQSFLLPASSSAIQIATDPSGMADTSAVVLIAELSGVNSATDPAG